MVVTVTGCLVPGPLVWLMNGEKATFSLDSLSIHPKQLITVTTARFLVFEGEMPDKKAFFFVRGSLCGDDWN